MIYLFELKICYPENVIKINRTFSGKTSKVAFGQARKWMSNCLAICGKDAQDRKYLDAELVCLTK
jgi:hypothetical protein